MAGRTAHHPTGQGATERATERQRLALAPPPGEPWTTVIPRERYRLQTTKSFLVCCALIVTGNFLLIWTNNIWLEFLGVMIYTGAVVIAGESQPWRKVHTDLVMVEKVVDPKQAMPLRSSPTRRRRSTRGMTEEP